MKLYCLKDPQQQPSSHNKNSSPLWKSSLTEMALSTQLACLFFTVLLFVSVLQATEDEAGEVDLDRPLITSEMIDLINSDPEAGWTAGVNERFINYTLRDFKRMGGAIPEPELTMMNISMEADEEEVKRILKEVPSFDARSHWKCPSMSKILDQGGCQACWAFAAVQVLQDRFCIEHGLDLALSPHNVLTCCTKCGNCDSGYIDRAYDYLKTQGTVTWGCSPYFDTKTCRTYPCTGVDTPPCKLGCKNGGDFNQRYYSTPQYSVIRTPDIMQEIMSNGPVSSSMELYEDLGTYKSGVYRHKTGKYILKHYVKLVGWGTTTEGERYWIVTNQWGPNWGESGHFRIAMGECRIGKVVQGVHAVPPTNLKSVV